MLGVNDLGQLLPFHHLLVHPHADLGVKQVLVHKLKRNQIRTNTRTLWCQLEDTVLLIGTLLLFDPVLFPKYEA